MSVHYSAQHGILRKNVSLGFHHKHGRLGACHYQVELAFGHLGLQGIQHILTIDKAYPGSSHRASERNAGDLQSSAGADKRNDVSGNFRIGGYYGDNNLNLVGEALREKRTDGSVNKTGNESFSFGRTAFALEITAGNASCCVGAFLVVNGKREKVLIILGRILFLFAYYCNKY